MSNIFAAIGRVQLKRLDNEFGPRRKKIAKYYVKKLSENKNIKLINVNFENIIPHIFPILVHNNIRKKLIKKFQSNNIQFGLHYKPNHLLNYYDNGNSLKVCENIYQKLFTLPLHPEITDNELDFICKTLNNI